MLIFMRRRWAVAAAVTLSAIGATLVGTASFATGTTVISGTVFGDTDGDGVHDADEFGIGGVAIWVVGDSQGSGKRLAAGVRSASDGSWTVPTADLGSGPFGVGLGDPIDEAGQRVSIDSAASVTLPDGLSWTDRGPDHVGRWLTGIAAGTANVEFGVATCPASAHCVRPQLGGSVWLDSDGDGTQGPGEPRIPGADVTLLSGGSTVAVLRTDGQGRWVADEGSVPGGLGSVDQVLVTVDAAAAVGVLGEPSTLVPTVAGIGSDVADSDGEALPDGSALAALDPGASLAIVDVGFVPAHAPGLAQDEGAAGTANTLADPLSSRTATGATPTVAETANGSASADAGVLTAMDASGAASPNARSAASIEGAGVGEQPILGETATTNAAGLGSGVLAAVKNSPSTTTAPANGSSSPATSQPDRPAPPTSVPQVPRRQDNFDQFEDELASGDAALGIGELPSLTDMPVVLPAGEDNFASTLPQTGGNTARVLGAALMGVGMGLALMSIAASRRRAAR